MQDSSLFLWPSSADRIHKALQVPGETSIRCQWHTKRKDSSQNFVRCRNPINKTNQSNIQKLLSDVVAAGSWAAAQNFLGRLSQLLVCQGAHKNNANELLHSWQTGYAEAEAQKRKSAEKAAVKPTTATTPQSTIKSEPEESDAHATLAAIPELPIKPEPKEEQAGLTASCRPLEAKKPAPRTHTFTPYGGQCTVPQINKKIKALLERPLSDDEKKTLGREGFIYIYTFTDAARDTKPILKIGYTQDLKERMARWQRQCGYKPDGRNSTAAILYKRVERLVHAQLANDRRREAACEGCGKSHIEFFDVRLCEANRVIGLWVEWMWFMPYDEEGMLKKEWVDKLRDVDLNDANCWETFTSK